LTWPKAAYGIKLLVAVLIREKASVPPVHKAVPLPADVRIPGL